MNDWRLLAACRGMDPDVFYPERGGDTRQIKAVCAECPVALECLNYALEMRETHGMWGGKSERERRRIRKDMDIPVRSVSRGSRRQKPIPFGQPRPGTPDYATFNARKRTG